MVTDVSSRQEEIMFSPFPWPGDSPDSPHRPSRSPARARQKAPKPLSPAQAERIRRRQAEALVSWTLGELLRCWWYRLRMTVDEMNYAAGCVMGGFIVPPPQQSQRSREHDED